MWREVSSQVGSHAQSPSGNSRLEEARGQRQGDRPLGQGEGGAWHLVLSLGRWERLKQSHTVREWLGRYCSEPIEDNGNLDVGGNKERNRMETIYSEQISRIFMFDGYQGHTRSLARACGRILLSVP